MMSALGNLAQSVESEIRNEIGNTIWEKFHPQTRIGIVTAEVCFREFGTITDDFDFSSVIMPIMKALEVEMKSYFYMGYIDFLREHYSVAEYMGAVNIKSYKERNKVLQRADAIRYCLVTEKTDFTIGNFRYTLGALELRKLHIDKPFLEYCKQELFQETNCNIDQLSKWLCNLIYDLEPLRRIRNDSAHGGKINNQTDAEKTLNDLIRVKKILVEIVAPSFLDR